MKIITIIISVFFAIVFASCEDVIQVKLDEGEPILTIDAFINNMRTQQKVRLTYTSGYFSQKANNGVTGATVQLKDLTTGKEYLFKDLANGNYVYDIIGTDTLGRVGHSYELTVTNQSNVFKARSHLNRTTKVDTIISEFKEASFGSTAGYETFFVAKDSVGNTPDFYWIKTFINRKFLNKGNEIKVSYDAAFGPGYDGEEFIIPIASIGTFKQFDTCRVELHSINLDTYNFLLQVQQQVTNGGLFATNPENIRTNITNTNNTKTKVVGWFCMSAVEFNEKVIKGK